MPEVKGWHAYKTDQIFSDLALCFSFAKLHPDGVTPCSLSLKRFHCYVPWPPKEFNSNPTLCPRRGFLLEASRRSGLNSRYLLLIPESSCKLGQEVSRVVSFVADCNLCKGLVGI